MFTRKRCPMAYFLNDDFADHLRTETFSCVLHSVFTDKI